MDDRARFGRRNFLELSGLLAGGALLAACSSGGSGTDSGAGTDATASAASTSAVQSTDDLIAASKKEGGEVLWYIPGSADLGAALQKGFQTAYPWTKVTAQAVDFSALPGKLTTEAVTGAATADVFMLPNAFRQQMLKNNVPTSVKLSTDAALGDLVDPGGYGHPCYILLIGVEYNTKLLKSGPPKAQQMSDPAWQGKIAFDRVQNLGQSTLWLSSWRSQWGDSAWQKWLDGLKANQILLTATGGDTYSTVLSGEREFGIGASNDISGQKAGTPMAVDYSYSPVPFIQNLWLTKNASHPATGKLFMTWVTSADGQQAVASTARTPALQTVKSPVAASNLMPKGVTLLAGSKTQDFYNNASQYLSMLEERWPS